MNRALRDAVAGSFRLALSPDQQRILVGLAEGDYAWRGPGAVRTEVALEARGLIVREGEGRNQITGAGRSVLELLREAGLYDERLADLAAT
ncbi:MAG: hypothetical protein ACRDND_23455 [Streptosporangiaceae bacterium]